MSGPREPELSRALADGQLADADEAPFPGLAALRDVTPPTSLVPAVMRRVAEPRPFSLWDWLRRPRRLELRLSPLGAAALVAASVSAGILLTRSGDPSSSPTPVATSGPTPVARPASTPAPPTAATPVEAVTEVVLVRFVLNVKGARKVAVAGDFNGWDAAATPLEDADGRGVFATTVPLPRGAHHYMFVVDGAWIPDPAAEQRPDGFGRTNAILRL